MKSFVRLICIFILCLTTFVAQTQEQATLDGEDVKISPIHLEAGMYFSSSIPASILKENMTPGFGLGLNAIIHHKNLPVGLGFDFNSLWHSRTAVGLTIFNGYFDERYTLSTSSLILTGDAIVRYQPEIASPILPYFDGLVGFNRFATWTRLDSQDEEFYENDPNAPFYDNYEQSNREGGDWTYAIGGRVGAKIQLTYKEFRRRTVYLDLNAAYRKGGFANYYVKKDNFTIDQTTFDAFEEKNSITDFLLVRLGVNIDFH